MASKLEQAKQQLHFVSRALENGYVDIDSLDELGRALASAISLISEHERESRPITIDIPAGMRVIVYEPLNA